MLEVDGLSVSFRGDDGRHLVAVDGASLAVAPGERLGLVGESGCGKTTTLLALMGLLPPNAVVGGRVLLDGVDLLAEGERSARRHRWVDVAMVFQGSMTAFNPVQTVGRQIVEAIELHGLARGRAAWTRAEELLERVGLPGDRARRYPHELSGGMRQRAGLAMALSCEPRLLLADEPTTALDVMVQAQVLDLLERLTRELGLALVLVTHDLGVVAETCERAAVMQAGRIVEEGAVRDLYHRPAHPHTAALFAATPSVAAVCAAAEPARAPQDAPARPPVLEVERLHVRYPLRRSGPGRRRRGGSVVAVDDVSLTVRAGEIVALVGESGSGKTTTALSAIRMVPDAAGRVELDGDDVLAARGAQLRRLRRRCQVIHQDPFESLDPRFTVRETVTEPLEVHGIGGSRAEREAMAAEALERAGLAPPAELLDRYPHQLSGGQRQRVAIAAALVVGPRLLIADEPVSMLDVSVRAGILELLGSLRREGMGILLITHDLAVAATLADRIAVMYLGRVCEIGPAALVLGRPRHPYTRALLSVMPRPDPDERRPRQVLSGEVPDATRVPSGCRFHPRCPRAQADCPRHDPPLAPAGPGEREHQVACAYA